MIHTPGLLQNDVLRPERRMQDISLEALHASFAVNAFAPMLAAKHFLPLLGHGERAIFASVSARVGSIGDNRLGGWYSYRASKAALNMLIKTASIEVRRNQPNAVLLALHPGTVNSRLSQPFRGAEIGRPAADAAQDLLRVIDSLGPEASGGFHAYSGAELPW